MYRILIYCFEFVVRCFFLVCWSGLCLDWGLLYVVGVFG